MRTTGILLLPSLVFSLIACGSPPPSGDDIGPGPDDDPDARPDDDEDAGDVEAPDAAVPSPDANAAPQVLEVCASGGAPFTTIGDAVVAANAGDTIEVCAGTYRELVVIDKQLLVRGPGGLAVTIIDAQSGGTAVTVQGVGGTGVAVEGFTIRNGSAAMGAGLRCDSSTLVLRQSAIVAGASSNGGAGMYAIGCTLDIDATRFEGNQGGPLGGGALLSASTGVVHNSQFIGNQAVNGAGLAVIEGDLAIEGNTFQSNVAGLRGGGLYSDSDSLVAANSVLGNQAGWTGGGIHIVAHAPLLRDNVVRGNSSLNDGGGIYVHQGTATLRANTIAENIGGDDGGGVRIFESACVMEANLIEDNTTDDGGGGVRISHVPCTLTGNIVRNNYAGGTGGGLDLDNDSSTVRGGEISGNQAGGSGGGIFAWLGPWNGFVIEDVVISNNRAWRGGGLMIDDNFEPVVLRRLTVVDNDAGHGGGLMVRRTNLTVTDSLFAGNEANLGGGIKHAVRGSWWEPCTEEEPCPPDNPTVMLDFVVFYGNEGDEGAGVWSNEVGLTVRNSILLGNLGPAVTVAETPPVEPETVGSFHPPTWRYNDTSPASFVGMGDPTGSNGNLAVDPLFMNPAAGDFHLGPGSACVDAGDPQMLDADGTRADMGLADGAP